MYSLFGFILLVGFVAFVVRAVSKNRETWPAVIFGLVMLILYLGIGTSSGVWNTASGADYASESSIDDDDEDLDDDSDDETYDDEDEDTDTDDTEDDTSSSVAESTTDDVVESSSSSDTASSSRTPVASSSSTYVAASSSSSSTQVTNGYRTGGGRSYAYKPVPQTGQSETVYISANIRGRYHKDPNCRGLQRYGGAQTVSLARAQQMDYTAFCAYERYGSH